MTQGYDNLLADTQSWLENNSIELVGNIDTMITMAMQTISKDMRVKALNVYDTAKTLTANSAMLTIPDVNTMVGMRSIQVNIGGTKFRHLKARSLTFCQEYWPDLVVTGVPKYYSEFDTNQWLVVPTPAALTTLRIAYRRQFGNPGAGATNWIIQNHYDFALTAVMVEASRFVIDDRQAGLIALNQPRYSQLRDMINATEKRTERDEFRRPNMDKKNAPSAPPDSEEF